MNAKRVLSLLCLLGVLTMTLSGLGVAAPADGAGLASAWSSSDTVPAGACITLMCPRGYVQDPASCTCKPVAKTSPVAIPSVSRMTVARACLDVICPTGTIANAASCKCKVAPGGLVAAAPSFSAAPIAHACIDLACPQGYIRDAETCSCKLMPGIWPQISGG